MCQTDNSNYWQQAEKHLAATDKFMAGLIEKYSPCALSPGEDYFVQLCKSIASQQLATKAAAAIYGRFMAFYDNQPTAGAIAATSREKLRELGLSNQKISYIHDLAAKVESGLLDLEDISSQPDESVIKQLVTVKGIGVWTAQMFLVFSLNRPDVLPTDDFGIRKALLLGYNLPAMPAKAEMETLAEPWRPWRSVACWYLWRSLDNA